MIFAVCLSGLDKYEWGTALRQRLHLDDPDEAVGKLRMSLDVAFDSTIAFISHALCKGQRVSENARHHRGFAQFIWRDIRR